MNGKDRNPGYSLQLAENSLIKHVTVAGRPGSGKSTHILDFLLRLYREKLVEPSSMRALPGEAAHNERRKRN